MRVRMSATCQSAVGARLVGPLDGKDSRVHGLRR
jgi:hypothetical protein